MIENFIKTLVLLHLRQVTYMHLEKHVEIVKEVLDDIQVALDDPRGLVSHQRRIAMMVPLGITEILEIYLHKLNIIKPGSRIKHEWLKRKEARTRIEKQCIKKLDNINDIDTIITIAKEVELDRNDMAYGAPIGDEAILKSNIERFFKILGIVEKEIGDKIVKEEH